MKMSLERGMALSILFVASLVGAFTYFDIQSQVLVFFEWLDKLGAWAPLLFIVVEIFIVVLLLPGIFFTLGAGFLFGAVNGTLYVIIGTTIGATSAFLIARHLFGKEVSIWLLNHPTLQVVDEEFVHEGWKIILLTRMVPFFPFKLSNYFFGLMRFSLRDFIIGTLFGIIPITVFNVYLGSLAANLAMLTTRDAKSPWEWAILGGGLIIAIIVVIYSTRLAQRALARYQSETHKE